MAKPGKIKYDFSKLDKSTEFQSSLNVSVVNKPDEIDIEKCLEGSKRAAKRFVKPLGNKHFIELFGNN